MPIMTDQLLVTSTLAGGGAAFGTRGADPDEVVAQNYRLDRMNTLYRDAISNWGYYDKLRALG